jgi:hypothetical protein
MSVEKEQPRIVHDHEILDSFWHAGYAGGSVIVDCEKHGKVFFDLTDRGAYETGELESLTKKAENNPERYIGTDRSVHYTEFLGKKYVWQCNQCRIDAVEIQEKVWAFRGQLSRYINERLKDELAAAVRDFKEQTINISGEDGWQPIETAPKNGTKILALMRDGTIHRETHWADGGGEDQPPFRGWFIPEMKDHKILFYRGIETPLAWKPKES